MQNKSHSNTLLLHYYIGAKLECLVLKRYGRTNWHLDSSVILILFVRYNPQIAKASPNKYIIRGHHYLSSRLFPSNRKLLSWQVTNLINVICRSPVSITVWRASPAPVTVGCQPDLCIGCCRKIVFFTINCYRLKEMCTIESGSLATL